MSRGAQIIGAWLALLALLAGTTALAYVPLGTFNLWISLAIATAKAFIILLIFMRLARGAPLTRLFAGAGFFWLALLIGLSLTDFLARA